MNLENIHIREIYYHIEMVMMKWGKVSIFIIIIILMSSHLVNAVSQNSQVDGLSKFSNPKDRRVRIFTNAWVSGNASSGKQFGNLNRIGIIKFDYVRFIHLKLFPIRWETVDFEEVIVIIIGLDQDIPEGPFDFEDDRVSAIVFN